MATGYNALWGTVNPLMQAGSDTTQLLSTATQFAAGVFCIDCDAATMDISHLGFKVTSVAGNPGAVYTISLQSVDGNGRPSGILGSGAAVGTFDPTGLSGWQWVALDSSYAYTATRGDIVAVVVTSTNTDAVNNMTISYRNAFWGVNIGAPPYAIVFDGASTYTKSPRIPVFAYKNSDASIVGGFPNSTLTNASTFGATVERGMLFQVPTNFCSTYTIKGVRWMGTTPASGTNVYQATLYSLAAGAIGGTTTALQSTAGIDADVVAAASASGAINKLYFPESSLSALTAGSWYALGLSTTGAAAMALNTISVAAVADFNAYPYRQLTCEGNRTITFATPVTTTTAFTATTTNRPIMDLIIGDFTAPSASGGGLRLAGHGGLAA